jgi:hypothetical protein
MLGASPRKALGKYELVIAVGEVIANSRLEHKPALFVEASCNRKRIEARRFNQQQSCATDLKPALYGGDERSTVPATRTVGPRPKHQQVPDSWRYRFRRAVGDRHCFTVIRSQPDGISAVVQVLRVTPIQTRQRNGRQ